MRAVLSWVASNVPLMIIALILAVLAWVVATEEADPTSIEPFQAIPVTAEAPEGMVIVGDFDEYVLVTVRAPESILRSLRIDDFVATVDLTNLDAGTYTVPVQVETKRHPLQIVSKEPDSLSISLDPWAERSVPVRVLIDGDPALGYQRRTATVDPRRVTVSGPSTYVTQVVQAVTTISVQNANADIESEFQLLPANSADQRISHVTLTPDAVDVHIPIALSGYYQTLAVKVLLEEGQVAPGYRIATISVDPDTVIVFGAPDVIAALPGFIETEPIDVEGAQADVIERPSLNLPQDITLIPGQQVEVRVSIEAIQSSRQVEITPEIQGLGPGLFATLSPATVVVILSGPQPLLEMLESDDVRVTLNLFERQPGMHAIQIGRGEVIVPEGVTAQSILPATVQVEILEGQTPTPTQGE